MSNTIVNADQTLEDKWREIEHKHEGRCFWQSVIGNRTILAECIFFPGIKSTAIVVKHYDTPIPRTGSRKPWPKMSGVYVYVPIGGNTWEGLEQALTELEARAAQTA